MVSLLKSGKKKEEKNESGISQDECLVLILALVVDDALYFEGRSQKS